MIGVLVLALLAGAGYLLNRTPASGEQQQAVCALLIDRTGSTESELSGDRYRAFADKTLQGCREKQAALYLFWFDQTEHKLVLANDHPYELWAPKARTDRVRAQGLDEELQAADKAIGDLFAKLPPSPSRRTDLLTALDGTAAALQQAATRAGVDEKYIVILSDGLQLSDAVNVETLTTPTTPVKPLVDRATSLSLVPPLEGVHVALAGVRGGVSQSGTQLLTFFDAKVEEFWRAVVAAGGGELCYLAEPIHLPTTGTC